LIVPGAQLRELEAETEQVVSALPVYRLGVSESFRASQRSDTLGIERPPACTPGAISWVLPTALTGIV